MDQTNNQPQQEIVDRLDKPRSHQQFQKIVTFFNTHKVYLWIVRIIFISLLVGGVAFAFTRNEIIDDTPSQTAITKDTHPSQMPNTLQSVKWKTFSENKAFLIKYPANWVADTKLAHDYVSGDEKHVVLIYNGKMDSGYGQGITKPYPSNYIAITSIVTDQTPNDFIEKEIKNYSEKDRAEFIKVQPYAINNIRGFVYNQPGQGGKGTIIVLSNGTQLFLLTVPYDSLIKGSLISQIIATFELSAQPTDDPLADWKAFKSTALGFSLKYPSDYELIQESTDSVSFGREAENDFITYLTITKNKAAITPYQIYKDCLDTDFPCISNGAAWGQTANIVDTTLGGVQAKSFYTAESMVDNEYHIIQTTTEPIFEAKMFVAGGGLDKEFNQILSTFKFLNKSSTLQ